MSELVSKTKKVIAEESDSDDDVPISELLKRSAVQAKLVIQPPEKKRKVPINNNSKANSSSKMTPSDKGSSSSKTTKSSSNSNKEVKSKMNVPNNSSEFYENTKKGMLVQSLMCRWWYAIEWPKESDIGIPPADQGYRPLVGLKGVFVSTKTDHLGQILDLRNKSSCPNFKNFARKSSEELKELCIKAYEKQLHDLIEYYEATEDASANTNSEYKLLEKQLKSELMNIRKINTAKADSEAAKYHKKLGIA